MNVASNIKLHLLSSALKPFAVYDLQWAYILKEWPWLHRICLRVSMKLCQDCIIENSKHIKTKHFTFDQIKTKNYFCYLCSFSPLWSKRLCIPDWPSTPNSKAFISHIQYNNLNVCLKCLEKNSKHNRRKNWIRWMIKRGSKPIIPQIENSKVQWSHEGTEKNTPKPSSRPGLIRMHTVPLPG